MNGEVDLDVVSAIDDLLKRGIQGREYDAISSFSKYYLTNGKLTDKQISYLKNIVDRYGAKAQDWIDSFDEQKRERFKMAVKYYKRTGMYFRDIINKYELNNDFIPSRGQYEKMCENKYVIRAIENFNSEPKFAIGDIVCFRRSHTYTKDGTDPGLIESVSSTPSFTRGDRYYSVLWMMDGERQEVRERYIKLYRQPKKSDTQ